MHLTAIGDSVDKEGAVKFERPNVKVNVNYILDKRNEAGLGTEIGKIGDVWKGNKTGQIYRDKFFYTEPDFGWISNIKDANKIKSKVSGIGWKIIKNNGDPIIAGKDGITWKDLRENPSWANSNQEDLKKEKEIRIQRVPYYETRDKDGSTQIIDLSEGTCVVNIGEVGSKDVYLVIGFAQGSGKNEGNGKYRLSWENADKNFLVKNYGCKNLPLHKGSKLRLRPDWSWNTGEGNWSARKDSMIVLGNDSGIIQIGGDEERPIVAVALGLVVNKAQIIKERDENGWMKILNDGDDMWKGRSWVGQITTCLNTTGDSEIQVRFEKCWGKQGRIDAIKKYKANVKLTYSYKLKK
ncbi:hypothetical protein OVS_00660 [Mycoplasma ovis str. Michigan]|uniref:DUF31 domain-containing protein n=1 Tax=Mycoplasma ovis str. Michigan TaxID=1415773 RepID=A0ABM5P132_9MOLU|nr:hypothetical protein [Mycoplasma ovis]AHC40122.1 hypothetical protein OVS_00660 [Mycoplasma ovis str. Michigan]